MNTTENREKMTEMVGDTNTYTRLNKDPTHKQKQNDHHPKKVEEKWIHLRQIVLEGIPRVGRTPIR